MATITFYNEFASIDNLSGSGLGFFGSAGFGASVLVGEYNSNTFVTNGAGTVQAGMANNIKYTHPNSGIVNTQTSGNALIAIPNANATLRINFGHTSAVRVVNPIFRIYDRVSTSNGASGVTTKVAELIHVNPAFGNTGSGDATWHSINAGVASSIALAPSPGPFGNFAGNGTSSVHTATSHDWYLALSASPDSIGSKTFAGFVSLEYL